MLRLAFRWWPLLSTYLRTSWTQVSSEIYSYWNIPPWLSFPTRSFICFSHPCFLISRRSMLGECQGRSMPFGIQRMCRSRRILCSCPCMVRESTFLLNIVWTFCAFNLKKITSCLFLFLWDLFAAEASVKRESPFGTPVLRRSSKIRVIRTTLIHKCLLWWTWQVSILKPAGPCRFNWSPASCVACP